MNLVFEQIRIGGDGNFGYLLGDRAAKVATIVDPAYSPEAVVQRAFEQNLKVTHIINTHGHHDHINGNAEAKRLTQAPVAAHPLLQPDLALADGKEMSIGRLRLKFLHTPGHSADHLVVYEQTQRLLISGDLLFVGKVGGTGDEQSARVEWESLQRLLRELPDDTTVWPGHDYGARPASTLALEKAVNPFLQCADVQAFIQLKADWPVFKKQHGLK